MEGTKHWGQGPEKTQAEDRAFRMAAASKKDQGHLPTAHAPSKEPTPKIRPEMPLTLSVNESQNRPNRP